MEKHFGKSIRQEQSDEQVQEIVMNANQDATEFNLLVDDQPNKSNQVKNLHCALITKILLSLPYQIFISVLTIYTLFSDDVRSALLPMSVDLSFDIINIILVCIFLLEIILSWFALENYRFSFFFFLDLISTLTMFLDINLLTNLLPVSSSNISKVSQQTKATRAATRIVRIVKLFRIIRIVKLYKAAIKAQQIKEQQKRKKNNLATQKHQNPKPHIPHQHQNKEVQFTNNNTLQKNQKQPQLNDSQNNQHKIEDYHEASKKQSQISKVLSQIMLKKVIIVVLLLMFVTPLFDSQNYVDPTQAWDYTLLHIQKAIQNPKININQIISFTQAQIDDSLQWQNPIIKLNSSFNELTNFLDNNYNSVRQDDMSSSQVLFNYTTIKSIRPNISVKVGKDQQHAQIFTLINVYSDNQKNALFSIGRTIFICILLIFLIHYFSKDINELIVHPIEDLMKKVIKMAQNPQKNSIEISQNVQFQIAMVHNAISKVGSLLSLVFGNAGAQIIGSNIMTRGDMNPILGGKKKCAIFGFCDIRKFSEVTQILQQDIMVFVNTIGQLIHSSVYRYGGNANKNIGQAFLLVWNIPENCYNLNHQTNHIEWTNQRQVSIIADFSLLSFIKSIIKINKDPQVLSYRKDQRLTSKFGGDYKVDMGFGLHIGWAIQGAIGSEYKIDASYLSPNVNMASRLEAATKQFGVTLLISQVLYKVLTKEMKQFCRSIDRVTVKGSVQPITLYTVDLNLDKITPPANKQLKYKDINDMKDVQTKRDQNLEYLLENKIQSYNAYDFVNSKKQLRQVMINSQSQQFKKRFNFGFQNYIAGNWSDSKLHLSQAIKIGKNDGPTKSLLKYMKKFDYIAPNTWKKYRQLTEK